MVTPQTCSPGNMDTLKDDFDDGSYEPYWSPWGKHVAQAAFHKGHVLGTGVLLQAERFLEVADLYVSQPGQLLGGYVEILESGLADKIKLDLVFKDVKGFAFQAESRAAELRAVETIAGLIQAVGVLRVVENEDLIGRKGEGTLFCQTQPRPRKDREKRGPEDRDR